MSAHGIACRLIRHLFLFVVQCSVVMVGEIRGRLARARNRLIYTIDRLNPNIETLAALGNGSAREIQSATEMLAAGNASDGLRKLQALCDTHPGCASPLILQATHALDNGDVATSVACLRQASEQAPEDPRVHAASMSIYERLYLAERAVRTFAADRNPGSVLAYLTNAAGSKDIGELWLSACERAVQCSPNDPQVLTVLARACMARNLADRASEILRHLAAINPRAPHLWLDLTRAIDSAGCLDDAYLRTFESHALKIPGQTEIMRSLGKQMRNAGRFADAATFFGLSITPFPVDAWTLFVQKFRRKV